VGSSASHNIIGFPRPVTGIALLSYKYMVFVPQRQHKYGPVRPITAIALLVFFTIHIITRGEQMKDYEEHGAHSMQHVLEVEKCKFFVANLKI
jgi:hypothetical protein